MHSILFQNRSIVHAGKVHDSLDRVENRHLFGDQLEGIAIARHHQNFVASLLTLDAKRSQQVICLKHLPGDAGDIHGGQRLNQKFGLTHKFWRGFAACPLVFRKLLSSKAFTRNIEGNTEVGWLLKFKNVQHHRDEAVHRIGVLAGSVLEVIWAQRIEGAKGQRVPVNQ